MDQKNYLSRVCWGLDIQIDDILRREDTIFEDGLLISLDLQRCRIKSIDDGIFDEFTDLEKLNLSHNFLKSIPSTLFDHLPLTTLYLDGNKLLDLPDNVFNPLLDLIELRLTASTLPNKPFLHLSSLAILFLEASNRLSENTFEGLSHLRFLELVNSRILPAVVFDGLDLKTLSIMGQRDRLIPESIFESLSNLVELNLIDNGFSKLPADIFDGLNHLKVLNLARNRLKILPDLIFSSLSNLQELDLSGNRLRELSADLLDNLVQLNYLNVSNNPEMRVTYSNLTIHFA